MKYKERVTRKYKFILIIDIDTISNEGRINFLFHTHTRSEREIVDSVCVCARLRSECDDLHQKRAKKCAAK